MTATIVTMATNTTPTRIRSDLLLCLRPENLPPRVLPPPSRWIIAEPSFIEDVTWPSAPVALLGGMVVPKRTKYTFFIAL